MAYDLYFLKQKLNNIFGFNNFKGIQQEVILSVLNGNDVFAIMPTGGGKSLCYQLPALILDGTAIIVSPLIALMKNQVDVVRNFGTHNNIAHYLNSHLTQKELKQVKADTIDGKTKLLYVAPETFTKEDNLSFFKQIKISLLAVDEAHCVSEWGHDFRPEYRNIRQTANLFEQQFPTIAMTATATAKVQKDIQKNLGLSHADVFISSFNRHNLYYEVRRKTNNIDRDIIKIIRENSGKSGIVYCLSRKTVDLLSEILCMNGIRALPYHAGLDAKTRTKNQDSFLMEDVDVIVATIAFGMGIDKPDVRFVIHRDMPKSLEGYYQETGRAGRDGNEGKCYAFFCEEDMRKFERFLKDKTVFEKDTAHQLIDEIISYAQTSICRRKFLLHYFGEFYHEKNCSSCDNCLHPQEKTDATQDILYILEVVKQTKEQFKIEYIANMAVGKISSTIKTFKHHKLDCFGKGSDKDVRYWCSVIRLCLVENLLYKDVENEGALKLTENGFAFSRKPYLLEVAKDHDYSSDTSDDSDVSSANYSVPEIKIGEGGDRQLFMLLKGVVKDIARRENVPPYAIFQETSLEDMSLRYPTNPEELLHITGVGIGKIQKYGQVIIDLIKRYVEENEITRPDEFIVKPPTAGRHAIKIYIIQSIDNRISLDDIAQAQNMDIEELIGEIEKIVLNGTRLNINYYIQETLDPYHIEDIMEYFQNAQDDSVDRAHAELGEDEYSRNEVRLMRIQFLAQYN
ncbi:MAG: DNA helicase RecQ [Bacteroidales bacterium]|jgi:ATP-dependent DNA helicase RecQ|nr:DNA helicase RecQ [Bacteroidales bacterium]